MTGVVKRCLNKVLHNKLVSVDELRTLLVEIEARVNNRPLTYLQEDINEPEALSPNHLLQGRSIEPIPSIISQNKLRDPDFLQRLSRVTTENLTTRFNNLNKVLGRWNNVWREDYLTSLREHHYGNKKTSSCLNPGDIVLIDCEASRANWPIGKVISIYPDKQGTLRLVKVLSKGNESIRTIDKLIPLEISSSSQQNQASDVRPIRQAAINARKKWN